MWADIRTCGRYTNKAQGTFWKFCPHPHCWGCAESIHLTQCLMDYIDDLLELLQLPLTHWLHLGWSSPLRPISPPAPPFSLISLAHLGQFSPCLHLRTPCLIVQSFRLYWAFPSLQLHFVLCRSGVGFWIQVSAVVWAIGSSPLPWQFASSSMVATPLDYSVCSCRNFIILRLQTPPSIIYTLVLSSACPVPFLVVTFCGTRCHSCQSREQI